MTETNKIDPKVSIIRPEDNRVREDAKTKASAASDAYAAQTSDQYKNLVEGNPKASDLGEFDQSQNGPRRRPQDPIQALLGGFMIGEARERHPSIYDHEMPYVPDLKRDIFKKDPTRHKNMQPVVKRYAALEKVIKTLIRETDKSLDRRNMARMKTGEIRALRAYSEALRHTLRKCRQQLDTARHFYELEKLREREAREEELADQP